MAHWFIVRSGVWIDLEKVVYSRRTEPTGGRPASMLVWHHIGADYMLIEGEAAERLESRLDMLAAAATRAAHGIKD